MYGNLIGINTMKVMYDSNLSAVDDINFSIPIERAVFIANRIFENKPYTRGLIGVTITDIIDLYQKQGTTWIDMSNDEKARIGVVLDECNYPETLNWKQVDKFMKKMYSTWESEKF